MLSRREHSRHELIQKLSRKEVCADISLEEIADELEQEGWLNDERCAEMMVRSGINRGHGLVKIRQNLQRMHLSGQLIQKYLYDADIDWLECLERVRCKRFGVDIPSDYKQRAKQARFLMGRGFDSSLIREILSV